MNTEETSNNQPIEVSLEAGKTCYWCSCGKSASQPFCDGSHQGSEKEPHAFTPEESKTAYLCTCKKTGTPPYCDGSHNNI